jgi:hypothetical protein
MFNQQGLSLDQAPPIGVVFRFFASGLLFGIVAGVLTLLFGTAVFDPASSEALVLTHTLTLGVMMSFMLGALFQMLPVIAGVKFAAPVRAANLVQPPFVLGTLLLLGAFYTRSGSLFLIAGAILGITLLGIGAAMLVKLLHLREHSKSSRGMTAALVGLILLTLFALYLVGTYGGLFEGTYFLAAKTAHLSFGLFGWIALLIVAVAFQVIEMFYVTPPYPPLSVRVMPFALLGFIMIGFLLSFVNPVLQTIATAIVTIQLIAFAGLTLLRLSQRKRPIADATVWFWRIGMVSLVLSMAAAADIPAFDIPLLRSAAYIFFAGFALSIIFAMFYKIVPFLTWFHLNAQGYFTAPMMHEVIHPKTAMKHLYIHLAATASFLLSLFFAPFIYLAGVLTVLSFGWALYGLVHAHRLYVKTQREGEKFEMNIDA